VSALTSQFSLSRPEILSAAEEARADTTSVSMRSVWMACRRQTRGRLDDLAQRIDSHATFEDLVLPDGQKEILANIVTHVRHRTTVLDTWGFARQGVAASGSARCSLGQRHREDHGRRGPRRALELDLVQDRPLRRC
jgi:hypothetical protein